MLVVRVILIPGHVVPDTAAARRHPLNLDGKRRYDVLHEPRVLTDSRFPASGHASAARDGIVFAAVFGDPADGVEYVCAAVFNEFAFDVDTNECDSVLSP